MELQQFYAKPSDYSALTISGSHAFPCPRKRQVSYGVSFVNSKSNLCFTFIIVKLYAVLCHNEPQYIAPVDYT